jgi:hypothetical protein
MAQRIILLAAFAGSVFLMGFGSNFQSGPRGAWTTRDGDLVRTLVLIDDYFSLTEFDIAHKKFYYTTGGTARLAEGKLTGTVEYHSGNKSEVGKTYSWPLKMSGTTLMVNRNGKDEQWTMTDDGRNELAGNWRITGREQNGQMLEIKHAARKTIKLLSGSRFQWAAINTETGEFFGTGGGAYTFKDGVYTEHIEFFSRDSSRVGMSLSFNGKVDGRNWHHSGKSSKGEPIHEVWSR